MPHYPMRSVEEVAAQMSGATVFSVLDVKNSFCQVRLENKSMLAMFTDYPCSVIVDYILIGGPGIAEHDCNLKKVLEQAIEVNLKLNPAKCKFCLSQVCYVGHITCVGLKADPSKTTAITAMPAPTDFTSLERFLGMPNYLAKYIPNFSDIAVPLRMVLVTTASGGT